MGNFLRKGQKALLPMILKNHARKRLSQTPLLGGTNLIYSSVNTIHFFNSKEFTKFFRSLWNASHSIVPVKTYSNAETQKLDILKENKNQSGIYRWVNNINGRSYVGSAVDLTKRLNEHYQAYKTNIALTNDIKKYSSNLPLQRALNKYGLNNFTPNRGKAPIGPLARNS